MMRATRLRLQDFQKFTQTYSSAVNQMPNPADAPATKSLAPTGHNYLPFDPLGGMDHKDYVRDPGGVPHYAPRNPAEGGRFQYQHAAAPLSSGVNSSPMRSVDVSHIQNESRRMREMSRAGYEMDGGSLSQHPGGASAATNAANMEQWFSERVSQGGIEPPATQWSRPTDPSLSAPQSASGQRDFTASANNEKRNLGDRQYLYHLHGFHDHDKKESEWRSRLAFTKFTGYDADRTESARKGKYFFQSEKPLALVPPSNISEAQQNLQEKAFTPSDEYRQKLLGETQLQSPMFGEDLTKHVTKGMNRFASHEQTLRDKERQEEFGLGRQGPLVTDGGPDRRKFEQHKNDERYLSQAKYEANAYKKGVFGPDDLPESPYERRRMPMNLYQSQFDMSRRNHKVAKNEYDVYDRQSVYLGVPIKSQVDKKVLEKRNARGERPLEYFMPFPRPEDHLLVTIYNDVTGMHQVGRGRTTKEEWGLFLRYREHWYQRRTLALRHNLEPRINENISQRDERRARLDALCGTTPYVDPMRFDLDIPSSGALRSWFGEVLPSSQNSKDSSKQQLEAEEDRDEVLLSISYLRHHLTNSGHQDINRSQVSQTLLKAPPCTPKYAQPPDVLQHFSAEQRARYDEYIQLEVTRHKQLWDKIIAQRKYLGAPHNCFAAKDIKAVDDPAQGKVSVILDDDTKTKITAEEWAVAPLEATPEDPNLHINWGMRAFPYMSLNYIEAQDYLWEERVYSGVEGWSPASRSDSLRPGLIVMARRVLFEGRKGDWERAALEYYETAPFYNPFGKEKVEVKFLGDGHPEAVPMADLMIWQVHWAHPHRTVPVETRKHSGGTKRYIDMRDPKGVIRRATKSHFLDAFMPQDHRHPFQSIKQITELDLWYRWDSLRGDNYRRLTVNDRKDFLIGNYFHKYTPWDMICHQEDDQPLMFFDNHYIRDDVGPSFYTNQNRFWTHKRRPVAYIKNYEEELRDFFGYVDKKVPWNKARLIVPQWEVRKHNPIAQLHSHPLAPHRNHVGMLPVKSWEADRKTGNITALKEDDISEYVATHPGSDKLVE